MPSRSLASPTIHLTALLLAGAVFTAIGVSVFFEIEIVARGHGRIVPVNRIQVVQPEMQGAIRTIHVRNGDVVLKDQTLIELDPTDLEVEARTLEADLGRRQVEAARLRAALAAFDTHDPADDRFAKAGLAHFKAGATAEADRTVQSVLLKALLLALTSTALEIDARTAAAETDIEAARASLAKAEATHKTWRERLRAQEQLLQSGHTARVGYLDTLDKVTSLQSDRQIFQRQIEERASRREALTLERRSQFASDRRELAEELATVDAQIHRLNQAVRAARRSLNATQLRAPIAGKIENLKVFSIGGVVKAGQTVLNVVPIDDDPILEVQFPNADSGFLAEGQLAHIKLDAFPSERFGIVHGTVRKVSSDAVEVADDVWVYIARVEPTTKSIGTGPSQRRLLPGMTATVDIVTGERRLISYFLEPIVKAVQDGLGER